MADYNQNIKVTADVTAAEKKLTDIDQKLKGLSRSVELTVAVSGVGSAITAVRGLVLSLGRLQQRVNRLSINDSQIQAAQIRVGKLKDSLDDLVSQRRTVHIDIIEHRKDSGGASISAQELARRAREARAGGLSARASAIIGRERSSEDAAAIRSQLLDRIGKGTLSKGGYNQAGLEQIIRGLGGTPQGKRADLVKQAQELVKTVNEDIVGELGKNLLDIRAQLQPLRGQSQALQRRLLNNAAPLSRSTGNFQDLIDRMAAVTTRPGTASTLLRNIPERLITTDLAGLASRQANYYEQVPVARQLQASSGRFDPLLKAIAEAFAKYTRSLNPTNPWVGGPVGTRPLQPPASYTQQRQLALPPASPQLALPAAGQTGGGRRLDEINTLYDRIFNTVGRQLTAEQEILAELAQSRAALRRRNRQLLLPAAGETSGAPMANAPQAAAEFSARDLRSYNTRQRRNRYQRQQAADRQAEISGRIQNSLVSGAFPLLFGAGPLATIGGFAGGALGASNPMIGVFTSALGQMVDQFGAAAIDMGKALRDPIANFQKIADAGLLAGKSQEFYVSKLIAVGRITEAVAVVQGELIKKIGAGGVSDLNEAGAAADRLGKVWAELTLQLQAAIAGPLADLLDWVANLVVVGNGFRRDQAKLNDVRSGLNSKDRAQFDKRNEAITGLTRRGLAFGGILPAEAESRRRALVQEYEGRSKPPTVRGTTVSPEAQEQARKAAEAQADAIQSAYREAFQLQRQAADISIAAADYRRKIESDIFAKNQEAARVEIDNARKAAQVQIEASDLALRKQFSGSQGLTEELLNGVRAFISARRSGEADIAQKRRQLEVTLADINKATADYIYEQAKSRLQLERQIEDYKMAAADYQLKVARQIQQETAIGAAGAAGTGPAASVATGAFASLSRLIGSRESYGGNYGAFNRGGSNNGHTAHGSGIDPNLVNMTLGEIQRRQLAPGVPRNQQLHAVGKYQIIGETLRSLLAGRYGPTGVKSTDKFTPEVQEMLGAALARNRIVQGNVGATMRGLRSEWIGLQYAPDSQLRPAVEQLMRGGSTSAQFSRAAGGVSAAPGVAGPQRPGFGTPAASQGMADAQSRLVKAKQQEVALEEKLSQLNIEKSAFDLQEIARGKSQTEALTQQRNLEQTKLQAITTAGALSENEVERLLKRKEGEAQITAIYTARSAAVLQINEAVKAGKLTQDEANLVLKEINTGLEGRLATTRTQIALEQELLSIQQAQKLAMEAQNMQRQLMSTGKGIQAGYTGGAAGKYDQIYGQTGDAGLSGQFAQAQGVLDQLQTAQSDASALGGTIAGGFKEAIKAAATGGDIKAAFANMLGSLGEKFLDMAIKPIEESLTKAIFNMLAPSQTQVQAAQMQLQAAQMQLQSSVAGSAAGGGFGGAGGVLGGLGSLFGGGGGMWGATAGLGSSWGGFAGALNMPLLLASGGSTGEAQIVGERGPELFVPGQSGGITNHQNLRSLMASGGGGSKDGGGTTMNMSFETTQFMDREWVDRQQLETAMATASKQGAAQGERRALDRLRQSPRTRRSVGI